MHHVHAEVEERARDRVAVDEEVAFGQMPSARAHKQRRRVLAELVVPAVGAVVGDRAVDRVTEVDVALDHVAPGRRVRILEVGHEAIGARVECVDRHLAIGRAGDLDPALLHVCGDRRDGPVALPDLARVREEGKHLARGEPRSTLGARAQQLGAARAPFPLQCSHEFERVRGQDLVERAILGRSQLKSCVCRHVRNLPCGCSGETVVGRAHRAQEPQPIQTPARDSATHSSPSSAVVIAASPHATIPPPMA